MTFEDKLTIVGASIVTGVGWMIIVIGPMLAGVGFKRGLIFPALLLLLSGAIAGASIAYLVNRDV